MIKSLKIKSFLGAKDTSFDFSTGVTLITGPNGSGKTTLLEALQWSIWGKNARAAEVGTETTIYTDKTVLTRVVNKSGESVVHNNVKTSKTKILGEINDEFGEYQAWSNTMLINSRTVGRFFKITNSERWTLIAKIVGAEEFYKSRQVALDQARACKERVRYLEEKERNSDWSKRSLQGNIDRISNYTVTYEEPPPFDMEMSAEEEVAAKQELKEEAAKTPVFEGKTQELQIKLGELQIELLNVQEELCRTCNQPLQDKRIEIMNKISEVKEALAEVRLQYSESRSCLNKIRAKISDVSERRAKQRDMEESRARALRNWETWDSEIISSMSEYVKELAIRDSIREEIKAEQSKVTISTLSAESLGVAGGLLIKKVIESLTAIANSLLESIESHIRISIDCTDRNIVIKTNLPGEDYANCSSGEQRRIDLCVTFALSSIVAEIGRIPQESPYIIDEAFDSLDEQGIAAVLLLACKLAETRQVFLVSHTIPAVAASIGVVPIQLG